MRHSPSPLRVLGLALALAGAASATAQAAERKVFVGCPILRNTTLPCWMGKDGDQLYYLGPQGDLNAPFYPPQFQHRMLVEGEVAEGAAKICGGIVLKNVTASVLPEVDESCNVMLPAEGYPDPPNNRGSGPSGVRGGAPPEEGRRRPTAEALKPPFAPKDFVAPFDADSDRKWRAASEAITAAARYAQAANAAKVEVTGYRAAIRLSSGGDFVENPAIAESRARETEAALKVLGLPKTTQLTVTWARKPTPSTGTAADAGARKVVIRVTPGPAAAQVARTGP